MTGRDDGEAKEIARPLKADRRQVTETNGASSPWCNGKKGTVIGP
jgi:hypothetical protein